MHVEGERKVCRFVAPVLHKEFSPHAFVAVKHLNRSLSCRIQVSFQGFEWFLYNRTAAYDNIVSQMTPDPPSRPVSRTNEQRQAFQKTSVLSSTSSL